MDETYDVIVIGGGLGGLAAGATATRAGARTVVFDARTVGGRARTTVRDGFIFNFGGHALYASGAGVGVLQRLGVRPEGKTPPLERFKIEIDGELHLLPATPTAFLRSTALGPRAKAQLARAMTALPRIDTDALRGQSTEEWIGSLDLRDDAERILRVLLRTSTYCVEFGRLSADAAVSQLQLAASRGVKYLHGGWGPMVHALARQVDIRRAKVEHLDADGGRITVHTDHGRFTGTSIIVAAGDPDTTRRILPVDPPWPALGAPVTVSSLDVALRRIPSPGYVMGTTAPVFATTQGPPADQAPPGQAVMAVGKYGAENATRDREDLEHYLRLAGAADDDVAARRFLPKVDVTGPPPTPALGGFRGRPRADATGVPGVYIAGDWVGSDGLLADATLASGEASALLALSHVERSATMVR